MSLDLWINLLLLLLPFVMGYLIVVSNKRVQQWINRLLSAMVYLILFFMGISLTLHDNFADNLKSVVEYTTLFFLCITFFNFVALLFISRYLTWHITFKPCHATARYKMVLESLQMLAIVVLGMLVGFIKLPFLAYASYASDGALSLLLLLVGMQLRMNGMHIMQILLNKNGFIIAITVAVSALLAGALAAILADLPLKTGLALSSGFGWYSLSGSLLTKAYGVTIGTAAFLNDLARELLAIMLIPLLIHRTPTLALGLSGATSMDFTLPVLQHSGGSAIVPLAIVHGFILSLLAPILMMLFS